MCLQIELVKRVGVCRDISQFFNGATRRQDILLDLPAGFTIFGVQTGKVIFKTSPTRRNLHFHIWIGFEGTVRVLRECCRRAPHVHLKYLSPSPNPCHRSVCRHAAAGTRASATAGHNNTGSSPLANATPCMPHEKRYRKRAYARAHAQALMPAFRDSEFYADALQKFRCFELQQLQPHHDHERSWRIAGTSSPVRLLPTPAGSDAIERENYCP